TLEEQGKNYKVKEYGRIKIYKTGLFRKIILIYNYSDSTFQICGNKHILEAIKKNRILYSTKINITEHITRTIKTTDTGSEKAYNLLIERQEAIEKLRYCKTRNIATITILILLLPILYIKSSDPLTAPIAILILLPIIIFTPIPARISEKTVLINTFTCIKLRREINEIDRKLLELMKKTRDENIKKIIAIQLAHSRDNKKE
ncbi:MAG: hypothetical protein DRO16_04015, partial [Thermoprotei archaeon]